MNPISFSCPNCETNLTIPAEQRREMIICSNCRQKIQLGQWHLRRADRKERREQKFKQACQGRRQQADQARRGQEIQRQRAEQARTVQEVRRWRIEEERKAKEHYAMVRASIVSGASLTSGRSINPNEMEILSAELYADIDRLRELGINLDKGALAAKVGGIGGAGYAAFQGNWILGIALGAAALLAKSVTDEYKNIQLQEARLKWQRIVLAMGDQNALLFAQYLQEQHALLAVSLQGLFLPAG